MFLQNSARNTPRRTISSYSTSAAMDKPNVKCTLYLSSQMKTSRQDFILYDNGNWFFKVGRKLTTPQPRIPLPNFAEECHNLLTERKLQSGFKTQKCMNNGMRLYSQKNVIAMHVSASMLINQNAPTSLTNHHKFHPNDKTIWDSAYEEEYNGLFHELNAFEYISEEEHNSLKEVLGKNYLQLQYPPSNMIRMVNQLEPNTEFVLFATLFIMTGSSQTHLLQ